MGPNIVFIIWDVVLIIMFIHIMAELDKLGEEGAVYIPLVLGILIAIIHICTLIFRG